MKFLSKITTLLLLLATFFLARTELVYAQNSQDLKLPNISVNPGSFYYPIKRLIEKTEERFQFSQNSRRSFYTSLLKKRLSELNFVVNNNLLSEVQGSSERFAYQAGILEEVTLQNKTEEKQNIIKQFEQYSKFLDTLRDKYPANSSFWMLVQHDINTLNILSNQLK